MVVSKKIWGEAFWVTMYTVADNYSETPSSEEKRHTMAFFENITKVLPCEECRSHFILHMRSNPILAGCRSKTILLNWVNKLHNSVNSKLGKPTETVAQVLDRLQDPADHNPVVIPQVVVPPKAVVAPKARPRVVPKTQARIVSRAPAPKSVVPQPHVKSMGVIKTDNKPRRGKCGCGK